MGNQASSPGGGGGGGLWGLDAPLDTALEQQQQQEQGRRRQQSQSQQSQQHGLDFSGLHLDGEPWAEAQQDAAFLSKVQKRLLDPALVAALQLEDGRQEEQVCERG